MFNPLKLAPNKPLERTHIFTLIKKLDENENFLDNRKKYSASSHQRERTQDPILKIECHPKDAKWFNPAVSKLW